MTAFNDRILALLRSKGGSPAPVQRVPAAQPATTTLAQQIVRAGRIRRGEVQADIAPADPTAKAIVAAGRARRGEA
jgi:hypothetical protein